jgi:polyphosphate glucokinase
VTRLRTLAVDIGGTGIKAMAFAADGSALSEPVRIDTPYPCPPHRLIDAIADLATDLPEVDVVAAGFPGLVRSDRVVWVNSLTRSEPGGRTDPALAEQWTGFPLQEALSARLHLPTLVANDADVHALASVTGSGMECVVTLGTGLGFSLVLDGRLLPHLEFGGVAFGDGRDYDTVLGQMGLEADGLGPWREHVFTMVMSLRAFVYFDRLFIGGGNARLVDVTTLGPDVVAVENANGLVGGHLLWAATGRG